MGNHANFSGQKRKHQKLGKDKRKIDQHHATSLGKIERSNNGLNLTLIRFLVSGKQTTQKSQERFQMSNKHKNRGSLHNSPWWAKPPLKSMAFELNFSQIWHGETFEIYIHCFKCRRNTFQIKFLQTLLFLSIICSFIKLKALSSLSKSFYDSLTVRMNGSWLTDHATHHSKTNWQYSKCSIRFDCSHFFREHVALMLGPKN